MVLPVAEDGNRGDRRPSAAQFQGHLVAELAATMVRGCQQSLDNLVCRVGDIPGFSLRSAARQ